MVTEADYVKAVALFSKFLLFGKLLVSPIIARTAEQVEELC
jgi:hypothetical protein